MSENLEIVRRLFRAVDERSVEPMFEIYDPDVAIREAASLPYGGDYRGYDGMVKHGLGYVGTWDSLQASDERGLEPRFFEARDYVFVQWRQRAHRSDGDKLDLPVLSMYRLRHGKVIESAMHHFDTAAILRFLDGNSAPSSVAPDPGRDR